MSGISFSNPIGSYADMKILQGKTLSIPMVWGGESPIDVSGFDANLCIKQQYSDASDVAKFSVDNGRVSIGDVNGLILFTMTATDSAALPAPFYGVYEIEITDASGVVYRALSGPVAIEPEVCR
jgi:hypothetical protein